METKPTLLSNGDCLESKSLESKSFDCIQAIADIRNKYTAKLEQVWVTKLSYVLGTLGKWKLNYCVACFSGVI